MLNIPDPHELGSDPAARRISVLFEEITGERVDFGMIGEHRVVADADALTRALDRARPSVPSEPEQDADPERALTLQAMVAAMSGFLDEHGAQNYTETEVHGRDGRKYVMTLRRGHRPSAHDLRMRAEDDLARLVGRVEQALSDGGTPEQVRQALYEQP